MFREQNNYLGKVTTVEADPEGAASFLRVLKALEQENIPDQKENNWINITKYEVRLALNRDSLWSEKDINSRGHDYEKIRLANLGSNCPVIDDIVVAAMTVTQMKTLDLTANMYQNIRATELQVSKYIDELDESTRRPWEWTDRKSRRSYKFERGVNFQDRYLEVAIPVEKSTKTQKEKLIELQEYATQKDITLVIVEIP